MDVRGKQHVVIGAGASGLAAARLLVARGARVTITDTRDRAALDETKHASRIAQLERDGVQICGGPHADALFDDAVVVVVSPGVPPLPVLDRLEHRGVEVIGEVELAARFVRGTLVAITGTNGKSTVTTLVGDMASRAGSADVRGWKPRGRRLRCGGQRGGPRRRDDRARAFELSARARAGASAEGRRDAQRHPPTTSTGTRARRRTATPRRRSSPPKERAITRSSPRSIRARVRGCARPTCPVHTFGPPDGEVRAIDGRIVDASSGLSLPTAELSMRGTHQPAQRIGRRAHRASLRARRGVDRGEPPRGLSPRPSRRRRRRGSTE